MRIAPTMAHLAVAAAVFAFSLEARAAGNQVADSAAAADLDAASAIDSFKLNFGAVQDPPSVALFETEDGDDWRIDVTGFLWLTAMTGDVGLGPLSPSVDASFGDILDSTDSFIGIAGRFEVGKGRWGGYFEGLFSKMGVEDLSGPVGITDVDLGSDMLLVDFGAMYRVCDKPAGNGSGRNHALDVYAGGRYQSIEIELDPAIGATLSRSKDWLDPIVGGRVIVPFSQRWDLVLVGDIGGFGVGSDLTWSARALLGYHFTMFDTPTTALFGYAALGTDYTDGNGLQRFEWDIISHGPVVALTFSF